MDVRLGRAEADLRCIHQTERHSGSARNAHWAARLVSQSISDSSQSISDLGQSITELGQVISALGQVIR
jgi:hypothetical protein